MNDGADWVFVDPGLDAADMYILNHVRPKDVLVTQDIGLASLVLPKGVYALSPRGIEYKEESIEMALDLRYLAAKEREKGRYGKGPKPFSIADREIFKASLLKILSKIEGD